MEQRHWWKNCEREQEADPEILSIDRLEDRIAPLSENLVRIRELIGTLEMCHHKAGRWVDNILEAIS
ncbi:MAG: hypothetical protein R3356_09250, partial [Eudoraea sp.]|nr:hypothetical protein [Eudoraea sp.]